MVGYGSIDRASSDGGAHVGGDVNVESARSIVMEFRVGVTVLLWHGAVEEW